jgi:hypothetical protein
MWVLTICACLVFNACPNMNTPNPCQKYVFKTKDECLEQQKMLPKFPHGYALCSFVDEKTK